MINFLLLVLFMFAAVYLLVGWMVAFDEPPGRRIMYAMLWMTLPWLERNVPRIIDFITNPPHETHIG